MELSIRWVYPATVAAQDVLQQIGRDWRCPWCQSEHLAARNSHLVADSRWVELPFVTSDYKWVCEGCVIEVYNACNIVDFDNYMDKKLVSDVAKVEKMSIVDFRRKCIEHQIAIVKQEKLHVKGIEEERHEYGTFLAVLETLIRMITE